MTSLICLYLSYDTKRKQKQLLDKKWLPLAAHINPALGNTRQEPFRSTLAKLSPGEPTQSFGHSFRIRNWVWSELCYAGCTALGKLLTLSEGWVPPLANGDKNSAWLIGLLRTQWERAVSCHVGSGSSVVVRQAKDSLPWREWALGPQVDIRG